MTGSFSSKSKEEKRGKFCVHGFCSDIASKTTIALKINFKLINFMFILSESIFIIISSYYCFKNSLLNRAILKLSNIEVRLSLSLLWKRRKRVIYSQVKTNIRYNLFVDYVERDQLILFHFIFIIWLSCLLAKHLFYSGCFLEAGCGVSCEKFLEKKGRIVIIFFTKFTCT